MISLKIIHKRDYLVKQFEEFAKVMGVLFGLKRDENFEELKKLINATALKYTQTEITYVEGLPDDELIHIVTQDKKLTDEQLKMLGDLLYEKGDYYSKFNNTNESEALNCFQKAKLIYSFLQQYSTLNYSLDMHYKLEVLNKMGFKQ